MLKLNGISKFCTEENSQMEIKQRYVVVVAAAAGASKTIFYAFKFPLSSSRNTKWKKKNCALEKKMGKFVVSALDASPANVAGSCSFVCLRDSLRHSLNTFNTHGELGDANKVPKNLIFCHSFSIFLLFCYCSWLLLYGSLVSLPVRYFIVTCAGCETASQRTHYVESRAEHRTRPHRE